jgi:cytochrome c
VTVAEPTLAAWHVLCAGAGRFCPVHERLLFLGAVVLGLSGLACGPALPTQTPTPVSAPADVTPPVLTPAPGPPLGDPTHGRQLFLNRGCAGCHTLQGVASATGIAGPNLTNIGLRPTLAGDTLPNSPDTLVRWLEDPPALKPGTSMPNVGLSDGDARDIAAMLLAQPYTSR